jgi:hypothetical protein
MENLVANEVLDPEKLSFDKFREEVLKDYRLPVRAGKPVCWAVKRC